MKENLAKVFMNSKLLLICGIAASILMFASGIATTVVYRNISWGLPNFFTALLSIGILISYRTGETNCQKMLIGSLIFFLMYDAITMVASAISVASPTLLIVRCAFVAALFFLIFTNHLILQSDHTGTRVASFVNQCALIVLLAALVFFTIKLGFEDGTTIANWFYDIGLVAAVTMIVCIETKIQTYRLIRAEGKKNGTWNDESRAKNKAIFKF